MTSFKVRTEDLTAHASHLESLTGRLDTAISAAESVSMSNEAYGTLCSFLPPIINPTEQEGINALKAAKEGVTATAENVRRSAKDYRDIDEAHSHELKKFHDAVKVKQSAVALRGVLPVEGSSGGSPEHEPLTPVMRGDIRRPTERGAPA